MGKANQIKGLAAIYCSARGWLDAASNCIMEFFMGMLSRSHVKLGKFFYKKPLSAFQTLKRT